MSWLWRDLPHTAVIHTDTDQLYDDAIYNEEYNCYLRADGSDGVFKKIVASGQIKCKLHFPSIERLAMLSIANVVEGTAYMVVSYDKESLIESCSSLTCLGNNFIVNPDQKSGEFKQYLRNPGPLNKIDAIKYQLRRKI